MRTRIAFLFLVGALSLLAAGCGSDDSDSETAANQPAANGEANGATDQAGAEGRSEDGAAGGEGGAAGDGSDGEVEETDSASNEALEEDFEVAPGGDDSIQTFGDAVEDEEKEEVVDAMRSFMRSLAAGDAQRVCAGLSEGNRRQIELFLEAKKEEGDCASAIGKFLQGQNEEATRAANGTVYQVRVEDENGFVLFIPEGGQASYFVMKREDDGWKATSLAPGTPFDPTATPAPPQN